MPEKNRDPVVLRIGGRKGGEVRTGDLEVTRTSSGRPRRKK